MPIFGDGNQTRAFTYISDVSVPVARSGFLPETFNEIYNIGSDRPYTVNAVAKEVARAFNAEPQLTYLDRRNEVEHAYSTHEKANRVFAKYISNVDLPTGVRKMADWARQVGARSSSVFKDIEIRKNLPPSWNTQHTVPDNAL